MVRQSVMRDGERSGIKWWRWQLENAFVLWYNN